MRLLTIPSNSWKGTTDLCGLVGMAGNLYNADVTAFNELLYADFLRGKHATGVGSVRGNSVAVLKRAWDPLSLMSHKTYDSIVTMTADVLIGHNRHGTMGDLGNHNNAHPFNFERVMGAHNGTLNRECLRSLHDHHKFDTDSEALYSEINENGLETAINKVGGAWALTFYDKKTKTINLIRNKERPLFFAYKKDRSVLYWASEDYLLQWVAHRNRIEFEDDTIWLLPEDTLYSWKVGKKFEEPEIETVKSTYVEPWKSGTNVWRNGAWVNKEEDKNTPPFLASSQHLPKNGASTKPTGTDLVVIEGECRNIQEMIEEARAARADNKFRLPYRDHKDQIIGPPRFKKIMENNCCVYCGNDSVVWGAPAMFLKTTNGRGYPDFLCTECCNDPERVELAKAC